MISSEYRQTHFPFVFDPQYYRRTIAGMEVVIHCHHYNARLQSIIENTRQIDGKNILLSTAEEIFSQYIKIIVSPGINPVEQWQLAENLYAHLGYGTIDCSQIEQNVVTSRSSHFVEGWRAGFPAMQRPICTFTEGYLQGVIHGLTGKAVNVREEYCRMEGAPECRFVISRDRTEPVTCTPKQSLSFVPQSATSPLTSANIDTAKIINVLVEMSFQGNQEGLIPAFNVYLSNIPADFYNLICIRFVEAMLQQNLLTTAKKLLIYAGEVCALNTLRGILNSPEWESLIEPMVKVDADRLHGLIAVTNGLAWSEWYIHRYEPPKLLQMKSLRSYEAIGYLSYKGYTSNPQCYMLTGLAAGIMEMLHGEGTVDERLGIYHSEETACICAHHDTCEFNVEVL